MAATLKRLLILPLAAFAMAIFLMALAAPAAQAEESGLWIAGTKVETTGVFVDLAATIPGVTVEDGGMAYYYPTSNMILLQDATIANPEATADFIDPIVYLGTGNLTIRVQGECTLKGVADSWSASGRATGTTGIYYGEPGSGSSLTIELGIPEVGSGLLNVIPGEQSDHTQSSGISGFGTLTINGTGSMNVSVPSRKTDAPSYALDLYGDLVLADDVVLNAVGPEEEEEEAEGEEATPAPENTAGLCVHGPETTLTLSGSASAWFSGIEAGAIVAAGDEGVDEEADLHVVATEGWDGECVFEARSSAGADALVTHDPIQPSITRTVSTCGMWGYAGESDPVDYPEESYAFDELAGNDIVELFPVYAVNFEKSGGSGTMGTVYWKRDAEYKLPACTLTPPSGYTFLAWDKGATGSKITVSSDMTLNPIWVKYTQKVTWERLAGATAPITMQKIAAKAGKTKSAIVTTDSSYKDALAASALAGKCNGLVLMTKKGSLTPQTKTALKNAGVKNVYIVGSTANVSANVEKQLKSGTGVTKVVRIGGSTPSQRAVNAAKYGGKKSDTVIIATQKSFQDALSIAPYSYVSKSPILYAETNKKLSNATMSFIKSAKYKKAIVVGGPLALPATIDAQLKACGVTSVTRLAGTNAYRTSTYIAEWTTGKLKNSNYESYKGYAITYVRFQPAAANKLQPNNLAVTTGQNWLDALAGAALCGKKKSVLLLADAKTSKSNYTEATSWCSFYKSTSTFKHAYVFGGTSAVQAKVFKALEDSTKVKSIQVYTVTTS